MSKKKITLSKLEWEIMDHIWTRNKELSVRDVLDNLYPNHEKAYTTVQTVMNTLVRKEVLTKQKIGLVNFYLPEIEKKQIIKNEMNIFTNQIFSGSTFSLANYLIKEGNLTENEIRELRKLIEAKQDN